MIQPPSQAPTGAASPCGARPSTARTVLAFLAILAVLHGLTQAERRLLDGRFVDGPYTRLVTWSARIAGEMLLPFEIERRGEMTLSTRIDLSLAPDRHQTSIMIRGGCSGIEALLLMLAGILALPAPWRIRLAALARYLPLLFALNLLRILALLYVMAMVPAWSDVAHDQVAQGVMVVVVLLLWMRYVDHATAAGAPS